MHRSGPHGEVLVRGILISVLGHSGPSLYVSGPGRVSISHLGRISCSRAPRRSARHTTGSAPTKSRSRARGGNARSSPTKKACGGQPRSRRPPGGRVAAWDRQLQIYHDETCCCAVCVSFPRLTCELCQNSGPCPLCAFPTVPTYNMRTCSSYRAAPSCESERTWVSALVACS